MARKLYSKEQAAEMLVMSDDSESDIDSESDDCNEQTIFDFESDSETVDISLPIPPRQQPHHSSQSSLPRPSEQCDWKVIDADGIITLAHFGFLGAPRLEPDYEEGILSTTDDFEMVTNH